MIYRQYKSSVDFSIVALLSSDFSSFHLVFHFYPTAHPAAFSCKSSGCVPFEACIKSESSDHSSHVRSAKSCCRRYGWCFTSSNRAAARLDVVSGLSLSAGKFGSDDHFTVDGHPFASSELLILGKLQL